MHLYPTENETIVGTARAIRDGKLSCVDVVNRCLANIDAREHEVHAWVGVDREGALNQAYVLDQYAYSSSQPNSLLKALVCLYL